MRLWSLENHKCVEEYSAPDTAPLVDFDFDESKVTWTIGILYVVTRVNSYDQYPKPTIQLQMPIIL